VVLVFTRLFEVFETGVLSYVIDGNGENLLRDQAGEALVEGHAQRADAGWVKAERGRQDQVRSIRFKQIGRTHIRVEPGRDQRDYVHEGVGRLAAILSELLDFFRGQGMICIDFAERLTHPKALAVRSISETAFNRSATAQVLGAQQQSRG
jgi:hypothetical protein